MLFGGFVYYCYGEGRIPQIIILWKAYDGKPKFTEYIFIAAIILFFILNNVGLCIYNP